MNDSAPAAAPAAPKRRRLRGWRWLPVELLALALLLGGLWWWSGSEGSLALALRWGQHYLPPGALQAEGVHGSVRRGGDVQRLRWSLDGLTVDLHEVHLRWDPLALFAGRVQLGALTASAVRVDDQSPSTGGPPPPLDLPVRIAVTHLSVGKLELVEPGPVTLENVAGSYRFTGQAHLLEITSAHGYGGDYRAHLELANSADPALRAELEGTVLAPALQGAAPLPLTVRAKIDGPLRALRAQVDVRLPPLPAAGPGSPPGASLHALMTPWGATLLPEAGATLDRLDLARWWPAGPATAITGQLDLKPAPAGAAHAAWTLRADLRNANSGPWDAQRLPLEQVRATLLWDGAAITVQTCEAALAGGTVSLQGSWLNQAQTGAGQGTAATKAGAMQAAGGGKPGPGWQLRGAFQGIDPARLLTKLAPLPLDGQATLAGAGETVDFDAALQTPARRAAAPASAPAPGLAGALGALQLREAAAKGRWQPGLLTLATLRVRTADAELTGDGVQVNLAGPRVGGHLHLKTPGAEVEVNGQAAQKNGGGTLKVDIGDLARTLDWARQLPDAPAPLAQAVASGALHLQGHWQGGWDDPAVQAELAAPRLHWQADAEAAPVELHQARFTLAGRLAQASLHAQAQVSQGGRQATLALQAQGGGAPDAAGIFRWQATLEQLTLALTDPALGPGAWRVSMPQPVLLQLTPRSARGPSLSAGAGELLLAAPDELHAHQARIAWAPLHYQDGQLRTQGHIANLPLAWIALLAGPRWNETANGDLILEGSWDADLGQSMRLRAELARADGDLRIAAAGHASIAAGIRTARLALESEGQDLRLHLDWDSEHAGSVQGELRTRLAATPDAQGRAHWSWPEEAPLEGSLRARLPGIEVWSAALAPPGWRLRGALAADLRVGGTRGAPRLDGELSADDLSARSVADGLAFRGGHLRARLSENRLIVDELSLRGSPLEAAPKGAAGQDGGTLRASGQAELVDGQVQAHLAARLERLHVSMRADRSVSVSGDVEASMHGKQAKVTGQVRVDQAEIILPENSAPTLDADVIVHGPSAQEAAAPPAAAPMQLALDLGIDLGEHFHVQGLGVDVRLAGQLQIGGSGPMGAMPRVSGSIDAAGGTFRAYGQQLRIARGKLLFSGPADNPRLDILALKPNYQSEQQVGVLVSGTALLPNVRLYAQPDLPDTEKLAWLMLGRPAPASGAEAAMLQQAALAVLGGRGGSSLASHFGLDQLSLSGSSSEDATLTLGKRLSDRLYTTYEHSLANALGTLFIYYELSQRWLLRGQAGANAGVDLIYTLSFD